MQEGAADKLRVEWIQVPLNFPVYVELVILMIVMSTRTIDGHGLIAVQSIVYNGRHLAFSHNSDSVWLYRMQISNATLHAPQGDCHCLRTA